MIQIVVTLPRLFAEGTGMLRVDLSLTPGSLIALTGPSGSGKTTLLRLIAGLETPLNGRIIVDDTVWLDTASAIRLSPQQRSTGYIFQDTALFPNLSVRENVAYAAPKHQQSLVNDLIDATGLGAFIHKKPTALSGGQRQRVALARALVRRPTLLLLDEPFTALDDDGARQLRSVVLDLHRSWGTTTLLVSHQAADVQALADRVIRLVQGHVELDQLNNQSIANESAKEVIRHICFDTLTGEWVIDTATSQLRSTNTVWQGAGAGDWVRVDWMKPGTAPN